MLVAELTIGRASQCNHVDALAKIAPQMAKKARYSCGHSCLPCSLVMSFMPLLQVGLCYLLLPVAQGFGCKVHKLF